RRHAHADVVPHGSLLASGIAARVCALLRPGMGSRGFVDRVVRCLDSDRPGAPHGMDPEGAHHGRGARGGGLTLALCHRHSGPCAVAVSYCGLTERYAFTNPSTSSSNVPGSTWSRLLAVACMTF